MRKVLIALVGLLVAAGLVVAQEKAAKKQVKARQINGKIMGVDEGKSTIMIKRGDDLFVVTFDASTKWTKSEGTKVVEAQRSDFKPGKRVICMATTDEKGHLVAQRVDLRLPK